MKKWPIIGGAVVVLALIGQCGDNPETEPATSFADVTPMPTEQYSQIRTPSVPPSSTSPQVTATSKKARESTPSVSTKPKKSNSTKTIATSPKPTKKVYYASCKDAPHTLYRGDPGYRLGLDGDDDGKACEK